MTSQSDPFEPIGNERDHGGPGEVAGNVDALARLFPDAVVDGSVDLDVLADLLGQDAKRGGTQGFGLRWPGMDEARRLSAVPATQTLLPRPDESVEWDTTRNIVIEGDNLEVLRLLRRGYSGKVDVIYIDPPYNTGNDFVYDDNYSASRAEIETVAGQRDEYGLTETGFTSDMILDRRAGASKHSKWLSMIYPRLIVAHHLLKETGVVIAAIDDTEQPRLRLLLDRVFGAENFIANVIWQGGRKNDSRYVSVGHDYMLIYAKSESALRELGIRWREPKAGVKEALTKAAEIWDDLSGDHGAAQTSWRKWLKEFKATGVPTDAVTRFTTLDIDGSPVRTDGNLSWPGGGGPRYEVLHPITGQPVAVPAPGWRYPSPDTMKREIDAGRVAFGPDHTTQPGGKSWLNELDEQVATSFFVRDRNSASVALDELFDGSAPFSHPKNVGVVSDWINLVTNGDKKSLIVDFFAGSGTTGHATMKLNEADGGSRRYMLVQLDEPADGTNYATIADITRERLRRAGEQALERQGKSAPHAPHSDIGFRSYRLASSNVKPWDGAGELNLLEAADNLIEGRSTDDLLVEMMLRLGIDLVTPVETREVAGSTLYSLAGTLFAHFGVDLDAAAATQVAEAIIAWRDEDPVDSEVTVVVRDTGFRDSEAKLNLAAALRQAGVTTLRSI